MAGCTDRIAGSLYRLLDQRTRDYSRNPVTNPRVADRKGDLRSGCVKCVSYLRVPYPVHEKIEISWARYIYLYPGPQPALLLCLLSLRCLLCL
jgi:hypothetical protein